MKVTILGAGRMGSAMAARLAETGHQVTVWDRDVQHAQQAAHDGVTRPATWPLRSATRPWSSRW